MIVTVVWATPSIQDQVSVELPRRATVRDAVAKSRLLIDYALDPAAIGYAIFGRRVSLSAPLRDGDRVELTRPLSADPKQARVRRATANVSDRRTVPKPRGS